MIQSADPSRASRGGHPGPELLAPAGHPEALLAAIENGADAVYLGLKRLSARASAANFSLDELACVVPFAHKRDVSVYVALNSAVTESERTGIPALLESLTRCEVDGVIVQDPGVFAVARRFFPELRLHASTLMAIHNHAGVRQLERMGAERVVLARELTLREIETIASKTSVGLEVFVHGALCYAYSGLCMASSFRGGHGGLQGRCVQPCRLRFRQGKNEGFFLSCNDLCLIPLIPELKRLRLAAFKIEGRMKSADYIAQVVKAYRHVLDAPPQQEAAAVAEAQEWLAQAPSRRLTLGYLAEDFQGQILTPHRSGSSGLWVGSVKEVREGRLVVALRRTLRAGDRLRPESEEGREKEAFTVSRMLGLDGRALKEGHAGETVHLEAKAVCRPGERLFRVGSRTVGLQQAWKCIQADAPKGSPKGHTESRSVNFNWDWLAQRRAASAVAGWITKVGSVQDLLKAFETPADWVMLTASRSNLEKLARLNLSAARQRKLIWALPPLIQEKEVEYFRAAVGWFIGRGFRAWELNNWAHFDFLPERQGLSLVAGSRLNVRNHAAMATLSEMGCGSCVLSFEITRAELEAMAQLPSSAERIVCVHAWPPLFTSRLIPRLLEEKPVLTPRGETFFFRKAGGFSLIYADQPMNWFEQLDMLERLGYRSFLVDLSDGPHRQFPSVAALMAAAGRRRLSEPHSLFNWDRRPV